MLREMTARQLSEWMAFDELEPFGPKREDMRFAAVVKELRDIETIRNTRRGRKPKLAALDKCALLFGEDAAEARKPKKRDWREMKATAMAYIQTLPVNPPED